LCFGWTGRVWGEVYVKESYVGVVDGWRIFLELDFGLKVVLVYGFQEASFHVRLNSEVLNSAVNAH
jgi:hypothetical protein